MDAWSAQVGETLTAGTGAAAPRLPAQRTAWGFGRIFIAVAIAGGVCRIAQYAADRSYWGDEAALVLNIRNLTARELLGPLVMDQAAPPLFLLTERGLFRLLGGSELSLRILPAGAGLASLVLFALLARRACAIPWVLIAVAPFAFADRLIFHATEVKPYGSDVFAAVLLMWIAFGPVPGMSARRRLAWLALAATAMVWFSYPAALVFAGLSLGLMPTLFRESCQTSKAEAPLGIRQFLNHHSSFIISYILLNLPVAASFLLVLRVAVKVQQSDALGNYWEGEFLDLRRPWAWPAWLARRLLSLCNYPCPPCGVVLLIAMLLGIAALWKRRETERLMLLTGPLLAMLLASALHRYPFDGARLTVFLTPSVFLLSALGFQHLFAVEPAGTRGARPRQLVAASGAAFLLLMTAGSAAYHLAVPRSRGHLRPIAAYVKTHARPGDTLYAVDFREFACYYPESVQPRFERAARMPQRFWIIWSFASRSGRERLDPLLTWARSFAAERDKRYGVGGAACLFERAGDAPAGVGDPPPSAAPSHGMHSQPPEEAARKQ